MPRRWRWLVPMTALIACAVPRAGTSAAPQEMPVEARVASAMQAATARAIANRSEDERNRARARAAHRHQAHGVVKTAMAQVGDGYAWGGSGPDAFDCSGLTAYAFAGAGVGPSDGRGPVPTVRRSATLVPATISEPARIVAHKTAT